MKLMYVIGVQYGMFDFENKMIVFYLRHYGAFTKTLAVRFIWKNRLQCIQMILYYLKHIEIYIFVGNATTAILIFNS